MTKRQIENFGYERCDFMTKEEIIDILTEQSIMETIIECSNEDCIVADAEYSDEVEAAQYFYRKGWRLGADNLPVCPKCAKKL